MQTCLRRLIDFIVMNVFFCITNFVFSVYEFDLVCDRYFLLMLFSPNLEFDQFLSQIAKSVASWYSI
uniref:Uncharacterized protein n=1 Tax=Arundo donax TaxID=35708 RepID=A0A0A9CS18_ARUDO